MAACIFCRIARGELPAQIVYRDEQVLAFRDINPQAPVHILVVPCEHLSGLNELDAAHAELLGQLLLAAQRVARAEGLAERGYRLVINQGPEAGQSVDHLHVHLLGGRPMQWPPG
jgi:histidine triad (HIT) family protein